MIARRLSNIGLLLLISIGLSLGGEKNEKEPREAYGTDLSGFNQYYLHGVASDSEGFPESFVRQTGGDSGHRLEWDSNNGYLNARTQPEESKTTFDREVARLAERIEQDYNRDGRKILLHGHSAGGVLAAQLVHELRKKKIPIAGMATYGTPRKNLRFHNVEIPTDIPVREFRNRGDLVLDADSPAGPNPGNVVVIATDDNGNFEGHSFDENYSFSPDVHGGLRELVASQPDYMPGNSTRWEDEARGREAIDNWLGDASAASAWSDGPDTEAPVDERGHGSASEVLSLVTMQEGDAAEINAISDGLDVKQDSIAEDFEARASSALSDAEKRIDEVDARLQAIRDQQFLDDLFDVLLGNFGIDESPQGPPSTDEESDASANHCAGGVFECPRGFLWPECTHSEKHDCPPPEYANPGPYLPNGPIDPDDPGRYRPQIPDKTPQSHRESEKRDAP